MNVLGINSVYHESSAALVRDGRVVAAAEEERFTREKHAKPARIDNPDALPLHAIEWCLDSEGLRPDEIDAFCFSFSPELRSIQFKVDPHADSGGWGSVEGEETFRKHLDNVPIALARFLDHDFDGSFHWVDHHRAHASSAYYASGFGESAVLVVDGIGEGATSMIARASREGLTRLHELVYPDSLGFLWEKVSELLGFTEYDACKVMGLAAYGDERRLRPAFRSLARVHADGFEVDRLGADFRRSSFENLSELLGPKVSSGRSAFEHHCDIAAALQAFTNEAMLALVRKARDLCAEDNLCLAGGLAMNCPTNQLIKEVGGFEKVYIPPAPHDAGTAIGAALAVYSELKGDTADPSESRHGAYLGPEFSDDEIEQEILRMGLSARRTSRPWERAAEWISQGAIVGWFQGRMEFGSRALGNRSILADPRTLESRERLNHKIKHREDFRPFAPSVVAEAASEWFELGEPSDSAALMAFACRVRDGQADRIPAVVHADQTARVQCVTRDDNPLFHRLIQTFGELTGVPIVLNTSFNVQEPIVCSPRDALLAFTRSGLDSVVIGNWVLERRRS